ncbi:hypothetical protein RJ55_00923 [Drechmeria coniospora]|nr:hypothetical protein RJ55_00923 [Drechmeria coniospora]
MNFGELTGPESAKVSAVPLSLIGAVAELSNTALVGGGHFAGQQLVASSRLSTSVDPPFVLVKTRHNTTDQYPWHNTDATYQSPFRRILALRAHFPSINRTPTVRLLGAFLPVESLVPRPRRLARPNDHGHDSHRRRRHDHAMASQQILFAETIAGMKKAFKRKAYESDSDSEIENRGNRGNKLKKRARFAHQGQLAPTQGPSAYKETVDYSGVRRSIIHRNPPLIDYDGYEINSDDDERQVEDAEVSAAELNPYANVHLEHILAPLTASTDLPTHSTLSKPFTSRTLTDLVSQSCTMTRKENRSLWNVRYLWTTLCGDGNWMPCGTMIGPNDVEFYSDEHVARHLLGLAKANMADTASPGMVNGEGANGATAVAGDHMKQAEDVAMTDAGADENEVGTTKDEAEVDEGAKTEDKNETGCQSPAMEEDKRRMEEGSAKNHKDGLAEKMASRDRGKEGMERADDGSADGAANNGETGEMENRRKNDETAPSVSSDSLEPAFVHPMFQTPVGVKLERDLHLPRKEAEDIRRLLALYVQKQEEICRGASRLHHGLLKAERLRKDVLHWAKAEAHCGPGRDMSDGEDWYDKDEWGLADDLKKGHDEEEEDTTTSGKKTRNRRQ